MLDLLENEKVKKKKKKEKEEVFEREAEEWSNSIGLAIIAILLDFSFCKLQEKPLNILMFTSRSPNIFHIINKSGSLTYNTLEVTMTELFCMVGACIYIPDINFKEASNRK